MLSKALKLYLFYHLYWVCPLFYLLLVDIIVSQLLVISVRK